MNGYGEASEAPVIGMAEWDPASRRRTFLTLCLVPALVVLLLLIVYPLFYNILLSFSDASIYRIRDWKFSGVRQYAMVFGEPEFWLVFSKTVAWTLASTFLQIVIGVSLAVVLYQGFVRGQKAWRIILLLPWAMPQYITALTWRGMFHGDGGTVNAFLAKAFGLPPLEWLTSPFETFIAVTLVNVWMGFPFMMIVALTGLRAIPASVYEAAQLEGASPWVQFSRLTAPLLRPVMLPATTLGIIWNFNNLNVIWLFSNGGEPADSTHILVSYVYKAAFTYYRFGWSAALSIVIFVILFMFVQGFLQITRQSR
ncbi:MAG: sugar ABC transporter permease [Chthoniobacterales bacterium]|nr:sugar ABC transporter permease [Chthoniobacterales bacterium]